MAKSESTSIFIEWAEVTTAHGFFDFARAKTILGKFIWFILIFFSLSMLCYQLFRGIRDFASHEWKTSIQELRTNVDGGVPLPSVIACNVNRLKYSKTLENNMTLDMIRFFFMNMMAFNSYLIPNASKTAEQDFIKWRKSNNFTLLDIYERMAPGTLDLLPSGEMDQQTFSTVYTAEYGKCVRVEFNINSTRVGSKGGSILIFDTQGWDYLPIIENNYILEGLALQVAYNGKTEVGKWIMMYPGTYVTVGIQIVEETVRAVDESIFNPFTFLNAEPPCERNPKMRFADEALYSVINCEVECSWLIPVNLCNCTPMIQTEHRLCEIEEYFSCFGFNESSLENDTPVPFISSELQNTLSQCERNCSKPCYDRYLETTISQTKFPSDSQTKELERWLSKRKVNQQRTIDAIMLDIHFNSLATKTIELYEVMSFDNLISSSGGLIGLWAGASFLTVFQAISYFFKYIEQFCMNRSKI